MNPDICTLELAQIYESQGHDQDALDMYVKLHEQAPSSKTRAAIDRLEARLADKPAEISDTEVPQIENSEIKKLEREGSSTGAPDSDGPSKARLSSLLEQWVELIVLKHRLKNFKAIKSRFI